MMALTSKCEACSVSVHLSPETIEKLLSSAVGNHKKTVEDSEFSRRMSICMSCESLLYKTTCRHCGCVVQIKARLENASCPYPFQPKW